MTAKILKNFLESRHDHLECLLRSTFHLTRAPPTLGSERNRATKNMLVGGTHCTVWGVWRAPGVLVLENTVADNRDRDDVSTLGKRMPTISRQPESKPNKPAILFLYKWKDTRTSLKEMSMRDILSSPCQPLSSVPSGARVGRSMSNELDAALSVFRTMWNWALGPRREGGSFPSKYGGLK